MNGTLSSRQQLMKRLCFDAGLKYFAPTDSPNFLGRKVSDSGLVVASSFPIVEKDFRPWKAGCYSDHWGAKGVQYVKLMLRKDFCVHVFNYHVQSPYSLHDGQAFGNFSLIIY